MNAYIKAVAGASLLILLLQVSVLAAEQAKLAVRRQHWK